MNPSSLANEFILTRLRMKEGLPISLFTDKFGLSLEEIREEEIRNAKNKGWLHRDAKLLKLSREGRLMADHLALELFTEEEDFS